MHLALTLACWALLSAVCVAVCPDCPALQSSETTALEDCRSKLTSADRLQWNAVDPCRSVTYGHLTDEWAINPCEGGWNSQNCFFTCKVLVDPEIEYDPEEPMANKKTHIIGISLPHQGFGGPLCAELGSFRKMQWVDVTGNALSGALPNSIGSATDLRIIKIARNKLNGPVPESWTDLEQLDNFQVLGNADMCGTEWLGAIAQPKVNGSQAMLQAIVNGGGYSTTQLGTDCDSLGIKEEIKVLQVMWTAGFAFVAMLFSSWALGTG